MINRLYFSRSLTSVIKGKTGVLLRSDICKLNRILGGKSGQSIIHTKRCLWTNSKGFWPPAGLLARPKTIPFVVSVRCYQRGSTSTNISWKSKIWTIVRGILLTTGGLVWVIVIIAYLSLDQVTVDVVENNASANALQTKLAERFYKEKNEADILKKETALNVIWEKLSHEEQVKSVFGEPVFICGYNYKLMNEVQDLAKSSKKVDEGKMEEKVEQGNEVQGKNMETADSSVWEAGCYIEGPKKLGIMNVKFEKCKEEWVPVSLHLETLENTGHIVSKVSGSLPNGIKNFTRLSN